ncbi:MAG TPA: low specificity L-threonine aldolase [Actinomycetes bacterium]
MPSPHLMASDNTSGVHPEVMAALADANTGHAIAYGDDPWTERARVAFVDLLGDVEVLFVWGGTGGNVVGLQSMLGPQHAVICPESAHINVDECGAPERFTGAKLVDLPTPDGKLTVDQVQAHLGGLGDQHHVQVRVVSITQSTEMGTVYTPNEVSALADVAHANGLLLHMDGARAGNAAAALGGDVRSFTTDAGVDVLTFGGTKNGAMYGEAVVWFDHSLARDARFLRKQAGQLPSKARFVAAQLEALLHDGLWLRTAGHANEMAARLAAGVRDVPGVLLSREPQVNAIFARVPAASVAALQAVSAFYVWDAAQSPDGTVEVRWMCSWDTTEADVDDFAAGVRRILGG